MNEASDEFDGWNKKKCVCWGKPLIVIQVMPKLQTPSCRFKENLIYVFSRPLFVQYVYALDRRIYVLYTYIPSPL